MSLALLRELILEHSEVMQRRLLLLVLALCTFPLEVGNARVPYHLVTVVDSGTSIPGGIGNFTAFDEVAFDGERIAFRARGASEQSGIYLWSESGLTRVADTTTTMPGGTGNFSQFQSLSLDQGNIAFIGQGASRSGAYAVANGNLRRIADTTTIMPGTLMPFSQFEISHGVSIDGNTVAFSAFGTNGTLTNEGVYLDVGGTLSRVADRSTQIPGAPDNFLFFGAVDASDGHVAFSGGRGLAGRNGVFTTLDAAGGAIRAVADSETAIPGLLTPIEFFSPNPVQIYGESVAFAAGDGAGQRGLYVKHDDEFRIAADSSTLDPSTGNPFNAFGTAYSLTQGALAFVASSTGPQGIFVGQDGGVTQVVRYGDVAGKALANFTLSRESLVVDRLAFHARFADLSTGIVLAEPIAKFNRPGHHVVTPIFDAGWSNGVAELTAPHITVQHYVTEGINIDLRAVLEFDLSTIPAGAEISSARLEIQVTSLIGPHPDGLRLVAHGYAGNGTADLSDAENVSQVVGESEVASDIGLLAIDLEVPTLGMLTQSTRILGIVLTAANSDQRIDFAALENPITSAPQLVLTYALPQSADFNTDNVVNQLDLQIWQMHLGKSPASLADGDADGDKDVDANDFLVWQRMQGSTTPASMQVPEAPGFFLGYWLAAILTWTSYGSRRGALSHVKYTGK